MDETARLYNQAIAALNRGAWVEALDMSRVLVEQAPHHAGVWFVTGVAALRVQRLPLAVQALGRAVSINPDRVDYAVECARALAMARMMREAIGVADRAMALVPTEPVMLDALGVVYTQANEHAKAADAFQRAVAASPGTASFRFNLAVSLTFSGDLSSAEEQYEHCLALDPSCWKAYLALSQLRRQTEADNHVPKLEDALAKPGVDVDATLYVNLALAKELEDLGDFPRAFKHLVAGKSAGGRSRSYDVARDRAIFHAATDAFSSSTRDAAEGFPSREPIFVIGMPRSGTTLVERILSSHPDVQSCGELQNFSVEFNRASGSRSPPLLDMETIRCARDIDWRALGEAYVASTRPGTGHRPRFVDKLPHNFVYAGYIATSLPEAKIVCLRRNPMDTCLGNFRQLFALTSPYYDYSFDLMDTGRYYLEFDAMMKRWQDLFPGRILEVSYEGLVDEQEATTRRLLEHCGLAWDDACMRFERNSSPVATASAIQVREPLNRRSLGRWKRYESELLELRTLLVDAGIEL